MLVLKVSTSIPIWLALLLSWPATGCPSGVAAEGAAAAAPDAARGEEKKKEYFQKPGAKVSEIVQARGYHAEEHHFVTQDGYVLGMTRALNPLIDLTRRRELNKPPLMFIHGTLVDGNTFVMNSFDIESPKDFTSVNVDSIEEKKLVGLFADEPSAKSLAFFALNFGHEVWFMHRRGAPLSQQRVDLGPDQPKPPTMMEKYLAAAEEFESRRRRRRSKQKFKSKHWRQRRSSNLQRERETNSGEGRPSGLMMKEEETRKKKKKSNSKVVEAVEAAPAALLDYGNLGMDIKVTLDKRLWNHSFDEQAAFDLPGAVDFVLEQTGHERMVVVGDSSGGALIMMSLVLNPTLGDKLSKAISWVPSFNIGHGKHNDSYSLVQPLFDYNGPYPFTFVSNPFQALMEVACSLEIMQITLCTQSVDLMWGDSKGMAVIRPEFQSAYLTPVSAHEYLQLVQAVVKRQTRMFDFRDKKKNLIAYGEEEPPYYNTSLIDFEYLSIYVATSDTLVTVEDIETVHKELRVPHRIRVLNQPGVNHGGALFHKKVAEIVIIPTYKDIISHGYRDHRKKVDFDGNRVEARRPIKRRRPRVRAEHGPA